MWKCICKGIEIIRTNCIWEVKTGENILAFQDNWINKPSEPMFLAYPNPNLKVSDFILEDTKQWNVDLIQCFFTPDNCQKIRNTRLPLTGNDRLVWIHTKAGFFTVKSAYRAIYSQNRPQLSPQHAQPYKDLWNTPVLPKVHLFLWKCLGNILLTKYRVFRYSPEQNALCTLCGDNQIETAKHLILHCTFSKEVWSLIPNGHRVLQDSGTFIDIQSWLSKWLSNCKDKFILCHILTAAWTIWRDR